MTAQELVEILLEDAPTGRSRAVFFHPTKLSPSGLYIRGDDKEGAVVKGIRNIFNVGVEGERAMQALDQMINLGYTAVVRNRKGTVTVYTRSKRVPLPGKVLAQMGAYLGLGSDSTVQVTDEVLLDDNSSYVTKKAVDFFPSATPEEDEARQKRREEGPQIPLEKKPAKRRGRFVKFVNSVMNMQPYEPGYDDAS